MRGDLSVSPDLKEQPCSLFAVVLSQATLLFPKFPHRMRVTLQSYNGSQRSNVSHTKRSQSFPWVASPLSAYQNTSWAWHGMPSSF